MSVSDYSNNVGEIVLRKDECFWIFPSEYINIAIYSPWFSYMKEKWRLVKLKVDSSSGGYFAFRVWRKCRSNPLRYKYTIQLSLRTTCINERRTWENKLVIKTGEPDPDYGCELKFPYCYCSYGDGRLNHVVNQNGLVKLVFDIQKQDNINNATESILNAKSNKDDITRKDESYNEDEPSSEDEINSDDKISSDDEMSSDEENKEKKNVSSKFKGIKLLSENLKQVLIDERMTDAVLKVDNREFKVHKIILVARSPVFASMFEHDMAEKKDNKVDIPDCTAESFEVFLHYLYSGSVEALSASNVYNVYYAADKYRVDDLKEKCVKFMIKNISVETFCDAISLSLRHRETKLQKRATDFFCGNIKKIIKTVQWQTYMDENSTQANELLIKALNA